MKPITSRLRVLRTERDLTQRDTAIAAGMTLQRYWEIENGYRVPSDDDLSGLARAFKLPKRDVLPATPPAQAVS